MKTNFLQERRDRDSRTGNGSCRSSSARSRHGAEGRSASPQESVGKTEALREGNRQESVSNYRDQSLAATAGERARDRHALDAIRNAGSLRPGAGPRARTSTVASMAVTAQAAYELPVFGAFNPRATIGGTG